jgi:hypothetical protein
LSSGPIGTRDYIIVISRLLRVLNWLLLFDERTGLTATGHQTSVIDKDFLNLFKAGLLLSPVLESLP